MSEKSPAATMPTEVTRSLAAVWNRYAANRPTQVETEIDGNVVRCVLTGAVEDFELGMAEASAADGSGRDFTSYRREASAAVSKATHRRVLAFISDHDPKTDVATEVFVIDSALQSIPMGAEGWIAR